MNPGLMSDAAGDNSLFEVIMWYFASSSSLWIVATRLQQRCREQRVLMVVRSMIVRKEEGALSVLQREGHIFGP